MAFAKVSHDKIKRLFCLFCANSKNYVHEKYWVKTQAGGTPLFGLYGDVPLDRVWFFGLAVLNRVCNLTCLCPKQVRTCPKQGMVLLFFFLSLPPGA